MLFNKIINRLLQLIFLQILLLRILTIIKNNPQNHKIILIDTPIQIYLNTLPKVKLTLLQHLLLPLDIFIEYLHYICIHDWQIEETKRIIWKSKAKSIHQLMIAQYSILQCQLLLRLYISICPDPYKGHPAMREINRLKIAIRLVTMIHPINKRRHILKLLPSKIPNMALHLTINILINLKINPLKNIKNIVIHLHVHLIDTLAHEHQLS